MWHLHCFNFTFLFYRSVWEHPGASLLIIVVWSRHVCKVSSHYSHDKKRSPLFVECPSKEHMVSLKTASATTSSNSLCNRKEQELENCRLRSPPVWKSLPIFNSHLMANINLFHQKSVSKSRLSRGHILSFHSPPSCLFQMKNSMIDMALTDKPVGKWLRVDSRLNVEHLFCSSLRVGRPSYFFNCWPCENCWLLPGASAVQVTADCISSAESCLSMDTALSEAGTPQTAR